jgi:outer membrane protein insertion porin family
MVAAELCRTSPQPPLGARLLTRVWPCLAAILGWALLAGRTEAQSVPDFQFEGKPVTSIRFEPADQPYPYQHLLDIMPLKKGAVFHQRDLASTIQALFSTGRFADIAVDAADVNGGVALRFLTRRAYFVGRVEITGVKEPPNSAQLTSATKLILGRPFLEADKNRAADSLKSLLQRNGFYNASIVTGTQYDDTRELVNLTFDVDTGERARFEMPVISGDPKRPTQDIIRSTKWQRLYGLLGWQQVTEARVQRGLDNIRKYYQKKDLLLARVSVSDLEYRRDTNTVRPRIQVETGPDVEIRTEGARIRKGKLKQLVPVFQERSVDRDLLLEGERNIVQYLQGEGYFEARVSHSESNERNNVKVVTYKIDRGKRHKLAKLVISGNHYFTQGTIRERLYVTPAEFPRFPHGRFSGDLLEKDMESIADLYVVNGFRNVKVSRRVVDNYQGKSDHLAVFIDIAEGPQTFVSKIDIEGLSPADEKHVRSILRSAPGQPFSETNVANDRDGALGYLYNNGFLNATFDYDTIPEKEPNRVGLHFVINPGPQRFVRDVVVGGLHITRPQLVFDRLELHPGDPLSLSKNTDSERRLYDLGIFARVDTSLQDPDGKETSKYVLYELDEARRYSVTVGVGAEIGRIGGGYTLDAPAGTAGFSPRVTLGVSRINFMGLGHTLRFQSQLSNFRQQALVSYIAPQFIGKEKLNLTLSALYDSSHDVRTFSAIRREASVQLGQRLSKANTLQYRIVFRRVTQSNLLIDPLLVPLLAQPVRIGLLGMSYIQDKRDDPGDAHRGIYTTIDLGYATKLLASQTEFTRLTFRNSTYHPLRRELIFARSTFFGWNAPLHHGEEIPISEHYFAGGASTHRGFPENQAGPRDLETGFPLGGNAVLMNNLELRFPLLGDDVGGVLFLDSGNVYTGIQDISFRFRQRNLQDFNYMVHSAGFGIRYRTPIGPVRLDFSLSPNSPLFVGYKGSLQDFLDPNIRPTLPRVTQRINQFQFHFSLGQAF